MRRPLVVIAFTLALTALHAPARAIPRPDLIAGLGGSFAANGTPDGGGLSSSLSVLWPVSERAGFGVRVFADDVGTLDGRLTDPNDGTDLGSVAVSHRWTYGVSWRGDVRLYEHERWSSGLVGDWGYWRIEDDVRGKLAGATSAVGVALGGRLTRQMGPGNTAGLVLRYHQLFTERDVAPSLVNRHATVAFEWCWLGSDRR